MAGITTTAAITAGVGLAAGGLQMFKGMRDKRKAQQALDSYERVELFNPYRDMQISTMGSDLMREENQRDSATAYDVLGTAGDRAILGGIGKVVASNTQANRQAALDLDRQYQQRQQAIASGEMNLLQMKEARDNQNIAALSSQINDAQQRVDSGMMGMASSIGAGVRGYQTGQTNKALGELGNQLGRLSDDSIGNSTGNYTGGFIGPQPFRFYDFQAPENAWMGDWYKRLKEINNRAV